MDTTHQFQQELLAACDEHGRRFSYPVLRDAVLKNGYFLGVVAVIENDQHQVLITRRAVGKSDGGHWECPGVMVKFHESSLDAVQRELKEELGILVNSETCLSVRIVFHQSRKISLFHVRFNGSIYELVLQSEEVTEACWASVNEIDELMRTGQFIACSVLTSDLLKEILS